MSAVVKWGAGALSWRINGMPRVDSLCSWGSRCWFAQFFPYRAESLPDLLTDALTAAISVSLLTHDIGIFMDGFGL